MTIDDKREAIKQMCHSYVACFDGCPLWESVKGSRIRCHVQASDEEIERNYNIMMEAEKMATYRRREHKPIHNTPVTGKVEMHESICEELTALYERKNHDYGDSFAKSFAEYGMTMPCIRLEDKLNRTKALIQKQRQMVDGERIEDTLMDLANYAIMTLIEMKIAEKKEAE
jgi:hypothetical protein